MTDEEFRAREEEAERELIAADAEQEAEQGAMLLEHEAQVARESGRMPALTPETAREEVRRALKSERQPATPTFGKGPAAASATPPAAPAPPVTAPPIAPPPVEKRATPRSSPAVSSLKLPGRSTDEIPIYRDIADDDDLTEPASRRGTAAIGDSSDGLDPARATIDSSDGLEAVSDVGDLVDDAVERLADTERLKKTAPAGPPPLDEEAVTDTDRLPRPDMPMPPPLPDFDGDDEPLPGRPS
jgi:hypothetical protein